MISQIRFAWKAKGNDKNIMFNNNKYNKITIEYLRCFEFFYLSFILDVIERVESHILSIDAYHKHLENFSEYKKFKTVIEKISKINKDINLQIQNLEDHLVILIQDIRDLNIKNTDLDEVERIARNMRDNASNINY
jgi:hypothetical protein